MSAPEPAGERADAAAVDGADEIETGPTRPAAAADAPAASGERTVKNGHGADASPEATGSDRTQSGTPAEKPAAATSDLAPTMDAASLPGAHRGGFSRELTGPVGVTIQSAPIEPGMEDGIDYTPAEWVQPPPRVRFAAWALGFAIVGLLVSLLVGWGFLLGVVGIIAGVVSLRRDGARAMAIWAIVLAAVSILYSAGWLVFAATQGAFAGS